MIFNTKIIESFIRDHQVDFLAQGCLGLFRSCSSSTQRVKFSKHWQVVGCWSVLHLLGQVLSARLYSPAAA